MIRNIEGHHNHTVKLARKLQKKKFRRERGLFVAEGFDLLEASLLVGASPQEVLVRSDLVERLPASLTGAARAGRLEIGVTPAETLAYASGLGGAADVIALFPLPQASLADVDLAEGLSVYLFGLGDPGNVGTLVRSAVAFGCSGLITGPQTADAFSPKAIRAGMGAQFLLPVVEEVPPDDLRAKLDSLAGRGARGPMIVVADPRAEEDVRGLHGQKPLVLVLGAERGALPDLGPDVRRVAIKQVRFDSLNVAMAGTVLLYELSRALEA